MRAHKAGVLHDKPLCMSAQAGNVAAQELVLAGSEGLIHSRIAHVIGIGRWPANVSRDDAEQEARLALVRALWAWDGKRPLTTLAVTCIDRQLRRWRAQRFPVLHMSRAAYTAVHGHVASPVALDDTGDGASRPLAERIPDTSGRGRDPLAILEAAETVRERLAVIAAAGVPATAAGPTSRRPHPRPRMAVRTVVVRHSGSSWGSLCFAFGVERCGTGGSVSRRSPAAAPPVPKTSWRPLRLDLDTHAA